VTTVPQHVQAAEATRHKLQVALNELLSAVQLIREASEHLGYCAELLVEAEGAKSA
jgi:hypothetical protein